MVVALAGLAANEAARAGRSARVLKSWECESCFTGQMQTCFLQADFAELAAETHLREKLCTIERLEQEHKQQSQRCSSSILIQRVSDRDTSHSLENPHKL